MKHKNKSAYRPKAGHERTDYLGCAVRPPSPPLLLDPALDAPDEPELPDEAGAKLPAEAGALD